MRSAIRSASSCPPMIRNRGIGCATGCFMSAAILPMAACSRALAERLAQIDLEFHTQGNYLFYLAVAPKFFGPVVQQLGTAGLSQQRDGHWRRVVIEKPFGQDLESAKALNRSIRTVLQENQIYRIDHYLGKETVQNIMVFRFDNAHLRADLESPLHRSRADHQCETVGVERRGAYFDNAGTLRDMVPNHVMQLLSLTAMEPPVSFQADAVRDEQAKVLHCDPAVEFGGGPAAQRARPVWRGMLGWRAGPGLPDGAGSRSGIAHRDLRRAQAQHRQLALGGSSVLFANGKAPGKAADRDCDPVPAHAVSIVPQCSAAPAAHQYAGYPDSAG